MKDTLEYLIVKLVDHPDDVAIDESEDESGTVIYSVTVNPEDMGKVIGKGGKIIKAVRTMMKILAVKEQRRVQVELLEQNLPQE